MPMPTQEHSNTGHEDLCCTGCGREDPCGVHYEDCPHLEPGDFTVPREDEPIVIVATK